MAVYDEILDAMVALAEAWKGESISTDEKELLGHFLRQVAYQCDSTNQKIQAIYDAMGISNNSGVPLDNRIELIGMERLSAVKSTATLTITVSKATTVVAGFQCETAAGVVFETLSDLVFTGAGSDDVESECTEFGPHAAGAGEITEQITVNAAVTAVTNASDAVPGRDRETDAEVKARHTDETFAAGEQSINAVRAAVSAVTGVSSIYTYENTTDGNVGGVSPQHIHIVVIGGTDDDVANAIANNKSEGTGTHGGESVETFNGESGQTDTIYFDRGVDVDIYIDMIITKNEALFPDDGETLIKAALEAVTLELDDDVIYKMLAGIPFQIAGHAVNEFYIGTSPSPTGEVNLTMSPTQRAVIDADNITISES